MLLFDGWDVVVGCSCWSLFSFVLMKWCSRISRASRSTAVFRSCFGFGLSMQYFSPLPSRAAVPGGGSVV